MNAAHSKVDFVQASSLQEILDSGHDLLQTPDKPRTPTESDRLERSFIEIVDFVRENGRKPDPSTRSVGERKLGARLDGIHANPEKIKALLHLDEFNLLAEPTPPSSLAEIFQSDNSDVVSHLLDDPTGILDTSSLPKGTKHVASSGWSAQRQKAVEFEEFEPLFKQKHAELKNGEARLAKFAGARSIQVGEFFVIDGMMLFIAEVGDPEIKYSKNIKTRRQRLRVIFENGTESAMYLKSLATRFYDEVEGYHVVSTKIDTALDQSNATGWIYVLRSLSVDPLVASRKNLYKIGFSTQPVEKRIKNAERQSTYLMAPVEIVATYRTYDLKTSTLEHLLHRLFASVRLDINQVAGDGQNYDVTEWFEVPIEVIDQAITMIINGDIIYFSYDPESQELVPTPST